MQLRIGFTPLASYVYRLWHFFYRLQSTDLQFRLLSVFSKHTLSAKYPSLFAQKSLLTAIINHIKDGKMFCFISKKVRVQYEMIKCYVYYSLVQMIYTLQET